MYFEDTQSKTLNIVNNLRFTTNQPKEYYKTIYTFGASTTFCLFNPDCSTFQSQLQKILNENNNHILVQNNSNLLSCPHTQEFRLAECYNYKDGDIVIFNIVCNNYKFNLSNFPNFHFIDLYDKIFLKERYEKYGEIFIDTVHLNEHGNQLVAEELYKYIKEHGLLNDTSKSETQTQVQPQTNTTNLKADPELLQYLDYLKQNQNTTAKNIGSIVMNCNPFTLGHLYLIEYAVAKTDHLYVFCVEEDKSFFKFNDRIELIHKGTSHLSNVTVLRSGQYIISTKTFGEYFSKGEIQDVTIDPSNDITIFGQFIAPTLNIKTRFAGEEPNDKITAQYNNTMRFVLPNFDIKFKEIPRKQYDNKEISASSVRKLLEEKDFESIAKIVPPTTLQFLKTMYI